MEKQLKIKVDFTPLDEGIEKANRLVELLQEAQQIINSLSENLKSDT